MIFVRKKVFFKTMHLLGVYKGVENEKRALEAILSFQQEFSWITTVRKATGIEDDNGIDIVVGTEDIGDLFVQVKSSRHGVAKYRRKHPRKMVAMVIVRKRDTDCVVWEKIKKGLLELREQLLIQRGGEIFLSD